MRFLSISLIAMILFAFKQQTCGTLIINSSDYNNDKGKAILFLFRKDDKIPSNPFKTVMTEIREKRAVFEIPNLPIDDYAAIILHDENDNGKIDHAMKLPSEQLGYSSNWQLGFFTGMPTFDKLSFPFSNTAQTQTIKITYKKNKK